MKSCLNIIIKGLIASILLTGCSGIGPKTIPRDRFDYSAAISESWENQMLLNMVKVRYGETLAFVDVTSIISQYAVEGQLDLRASFNNPLADGGNTQSVGGTGKYTDRPTITYAPMMGEKFGKTMMTPIPPPAVFFLIQSGWPVDFIVRACIKSINGLQNRSGTLMLRHESDPEFYNLVSMLRNIQESGGVGVRIEVDKSNNQRTVFVFRRRKIESEAKSKITSLQTLLNLEPGHDEYRVVYGASPGDTKEIAVLTRSLIEIIFELSSYIDIPDEHIAEGRSFSTLLGRMDKSEEFGPLIEIHSQVEPPADSFVSVKHRGHHFWISDRDMRSKRMFSFMMLLFTLVEPKETLAPLVTIPTS